MDISIDITLFWGIINFIFIYLIFRYFLAGKIYSAVKNRREEIRRELEDAKKDREDSIAIREKIERELEDTREKKREILTIASKDAELIKKEITKEAKVLKEEILSSGKKELEKLKVDLENSTKKDILNLSTTIAEKLLERSVDKKVEDRVLKEFKDKLGSNS